LEEGIGAIKMTNKTLKNDFVHLAKLSVKDFFSISLSSIVATLTQIIVCFQN
jgi:hypothetical protein